MTKSRSTGKSNTARKGVRAAAATKKRRPRQQAGTADKATPTDRRECGDRRNDDRRTTDQPVAEDHRQLQRREKVNRRRQIDPTTCEREYTDEELEFMTALDLYKRRSGRMFPTCSEILEVIVSLGYRRVEKAPSHAADAMAAAGAGAGEPPQVQSLPSLE